MTAAAVWAALRQEDAAKAHLAGCHRLVAPAETVARVRPLMARMGITRIANLTGLDRIGVPVTMVCRPNARSVAVSQGKGLTLEAATASGLMEAAELFHAEHIEQPLKLGSERQLAPRHPLVDLARLPRSSDLYHPDLTMLWIEGCDLISGEARWLPFETVRADFTLPPPPGSGCFDCSTNGLASGNSMIEAVCHAICEVVERDATALWHASGLEAQGARGLDPASIDDPACREVLAKFAQAECEITIWETTSDLEIPSFFCLLTDRRDPLAHLGIGAGTHPSPAIALMRALTEAAQTRTTYIAGSRDDLMPEEYSPETRARKARTAAIWREAHRPQRDFGKVTGRLSAWFSQDLDWLLGRLTANGIREVVAVDLRQGDLGLCVARVVVPGLESPHDHPGYRHGPRAKAVQAKADQASVGQDRAGP